MAGALCISVFQHSVIPYLMVFAAQSRAECGYGPERISTQGVMKGVPGR